MKILSLQTDIRWLSPRENRLGAQRLIEASPGADLIVLPEMFTTGFVLDPTGVAEPVCGSTDAGHEGGETLAWMREMASCHDAAMAGSVAVEQGGRYFNRFLFVKPDGSVTSYDKRHLFSFVREDRAYTAGTGRVVVEWRGWRILLQVCYDLRFPVFARNRGDYDLILYAANWPTSRIGVWNTLLAARAIENVCYVVGVNRTGDDPAASYSGHSAVVNYRGETIAEATDGREQALLCEIDRQALEAFRAKFPALGDADDFELIIDR